MADSLGRVYEIVRDFHAKKDFSRSSFDELVMLTDANETSLPKKFIQIVRETDENFPLQSFRKDFTDRLLTILQVSKEYDLVPSTNDELDTDELVPTFYLGKNDKTKVLNLCAQMRKIVLATTVFDQPHKRRLLNRIAGIEYQIEQQKGLLDVVRAGISDVGETLGKFGTDIKPLTERMKEVFQIARSNSKQYDQIPAPEEVKKLPAPDQGDEE